MMNYALMRMVSQALSLLFGSTGVFCLWASFYAPRFGLEAILLLLVATAITLAPTRAK